jgi:hypothetical protein
MNIISVENKEVIDKHASKLAKKQKKNKKENDNEDKSSKDKAESINEEEKENIQKLEEFAESKRYKERYFEECPDKTCRNCGEKGHISNMCPKERKVKLKSE